MTDREFATDIVGRWYRGVHNKVEHLELVELVAYIEDGFRDVREGALARVQRRILKFVTEATTHTWDRKAAKLLQEIDRIGRDTLQ